MWLFVVDISADFPGCEHTDIQTPNTDAGAAADTRLNSAFVTAPESRDMITLPKPVTLLSRFFRSNGCHASNVSVADSLQSAEDAEDAAADPAVRIARKDDRVV